MRIDIILESNNSPETVLKLGKLAEEVGLGGVWVSNMNDSRDPFINFVPLAIGSDRIKLGPIAVSPFELHPLKMASSLITLNEMAKGRAQIVVGAGGGTVGVMGIKPTRIVRAVRECVEIIKAAATGKPVQYKGEIFKVRWYDATWIEHNPPLIYVGANGPQMLASAARYADGIMVSDFVPERVIWARKHIDPALEEVGRNVDTFPVNNFWAWHVKESKEDIPAPEQETPGLEKNQPQLHQGERGPTGGRMKRAQDQGPGKKHRHPAHGKLRPDHGQDPGENHDQGFIQA